MNKYRIYLNNANLADSVDISADYPMVMGNVTIFYISTDDDDPEISASIPSNLVFIKL